MAKTRWSTCGPTSAIWSAASCACWSMRRSKIVFEVRRFGRNRPSRLEFLSTDGPRTPKPRERRDISRRDSAARWPRIFPMRTWNRSPARRISNIRFPVSTFAAMMTEGRRGCGNFGGAAGERRRNSQWRADVTDCYGSIGRANARRGARSKALRMFLPEGTARETRQRATRAGFVRARRDFRAHRKWLDASAPSISPIPEISKAG